MKKVSLIVITVLLLIGCFAEQYKSVPCNEIIDQRLESIAFEELKPETALDWLQKKFPSLNISVSRQDGLSYSWVSEGKGYGITVMDHIKSIKQGFNMRPTIGDILKCYGTPEFYEITLVRGIESNGAEMTIWYPSKGYVFHAVRTGWFRYKGFDKNASLYVVEIGPPGTAEQLAYYLYIADYAKNIVNKLKEWPEPFSTVEIDNN